MPTAALVFPTLGGGLLLLAAVLAVRSWARFSRWVAATGSVVGFRVRRSRRNGRVRTYHHPQVRYVVDGRERVHESSLSTSRPRRAVGEAVALLYDPRSPDTACIDELGEKYFIPMILGAIGAVFCGVGVWLVPPAPM
ncbi:MAG: DUF3592 domain-containing protein [Polyangiales bacterium]